MDPQEGDIADLPDGRTAVFQGGRWVVQGGQPQAQSGPAGIPGFVPFQSPSEQRADRRLDLTEETAARSTRNEERSIEQQGQAQSRQGRQDESDLRREFLALPEVKEFKAIGSSYRNVVATANNDSAAGDLSLIFAFMKILDPNSVVREQEFANAQNAAGVPDQIRNAYNRALNGERLSERQRVDFVTQARSVYENRAAVYNETANYYRGLAADYGFDPDNLGATLVEIDTAPVSVNQKQVTEEEANNPNLLSAQGYRYDGGTDTWVRDANAAQVADTRSQEMGIGRRADTFVRGIADGVTFGLADEISAGLNTVLPLDRGTVSGFGQGGFRQAYDSNLAAVRGVDATDAQQMPLTRGAGQLVGAVAAPGSMASGRYIAAAPSMLSAAGRGAGVGAMAGAAYGAGSAEGPIESRLQGAQAGAMTGAVAGGALSAGGRAVGGAIDGAMGRMMTGPRAQAVQTLRDNGVSVMPGQALGGLPATLENLAKRAPILGPAVRGAAQRGEESLNRAVGNRALDAIGEGVPASVDVGGDMAAYVQQQLGAQFDRAYSMVPQFAPDDALGQGLARIGQQKTDLPPAMQQQFDNIIGERLARLGASPSGQQVGAIRTELNGLAAGYLRAQDPAQQGLGRMLTEVADELDGAVSRANPEAGRILSQARDGYGDYIRLERASTAAGGRPFSPGQLESAVRASDGSVRRGAVGRGEARMQDLSSAARMVMPDQFGNPGTADGVGLGAMGVGALADPVTTTGVAAGLGVAATPYLMMGRRVVERLPANASRRELEAAAKELDGLAAQDSNVISLRDEIARRIGQTVPAVAQQTVPERRLMTGSR
jgi:hypothetical protein